VASPRCSAPSSLAEPLDEWWQITRLDAPEAASLPSRVPSVARARLRAVA